MQSTRLSAAKQMTADIGAATVTNLRARAVGFVFAVRKAERADAVRYEDKPFRSRMLLVVATISGDT